MKVSRRSWGVVGTVALLGALAPYALYWPPLHALKLRLLGRATVAERLAQHGPAARTRLAPEFTAAGLAYPPARIVLLGLKHERELQLYAASADGPLRWVRTWPILGLSGSLGPKLREGDRQVPEGFYRIESLNPNSRFHLALRLDYPNADDRARAAHDGRADLGGDIMLHGATASIGCLALGDAVAEELFVLAADTRPPRIEVVLSPVDFRQTDLPSNFRAPTVWTPALYAALRARVRALPAPFAAQGK